MVKLGGFPAVAASVQSPGSSIAAVAVVADKGIGDYVVVRNSGGLVVGLPGVEFYDCRVPTDGDLSRMDGPTPFIVPPTAQNAADLTWTCKYLIYRRVVRP